MAPQPTLVPLPARILPRAQVPQRPQQRPRHPRPAARRLSIRQLHLVTQPNLLFRIQLGSQTRAHAPPRTSRQSSVNRPPLRPKRNCRRETLYAVSHLHQWTNESRRRKTLPPTDQPQPRSKKGASVPAAGRTATGAGGAPSTGGAPNDCVIGAGKGIPLPRPVRNTTITGSIITTVIGGGITAT